MAKISSPLTEIPIRKTEMSVTEPGHPLIWTHRKLTGFIWRDPKSSKTTLNKLPEINSFCLCTDFWDRHGANIATLKKERDYRFFFFFLNPNPFTTCHVERWKTHLDGKILISFNFVSSKYLNSSLLVNFEETCFFLICQKDCSLKWRNKHRAFCDF